MKFYKHKYFSIVESLFLMSIGCLVFAIGFNLFIFPLHFLTGGVTGISIVVNEVLGIAPAYTQWALNIPLFFLGWSVIGNEYAIKIIYGSFFLPFMVKITEWLVNYAPDIHKLISLVLGAILLGLGLGLILGANGSTGGLDIPARILSKMTHLSLGVCIGIVDAFVITSGAIAFQLINQTGLEKGLYALIVLLIMTIMIDLCTLNHPGKNSLKYLLKRKGTY
jgi:uncharacterized membrane-anchored protein YitT (DUF2179 family)